MTAHRSATCRVTSKAALRWSSPAIKARRETLVLTAGMRKQPVVLHPNAYTETVRVKLPAGFEVDEMPDAVKMDAPFGSYETVYQVKDGQLVFTRKLVVRAATIP